jgi:hypothetical protein
VIIFSALFALSPITERANIAKPLQKLFAGNINDLWKKSVDVEQIAHHYLVLITR